MKEIDYNIQLSKIEGLKWIPYIGEKYSENKSKTMIFGESYYKGENGTNDGIDYFAFNNFTTMFIKDHVLALNDKERRVTAYRNLERAIFLLPNVTYGNRVDMWQNVCHNNFIQKVFSNIKERPDRIDYLKGWECFFKTIEVLKPNQCIMIGVGSFYSLDEASLKSNFKIENRKEFEKINKVKPRVINIFQNEYKCKLIFLKHSSAYFSWNKWGEFFKGNLENFNQ